MAAGLMVIIAMNASIGRIGPLEILTLSVVSIIFFEINNQLFWRMWITDCGYIMRVFLFGSFTGITSGVVLWKRHTTEDNPAYGSNYFSQTYALIGSTIVWIFFPVVCIIDLYRNPTLSSGDNFILTIVIVNTILALVSSAISSLAASMLLHGKFAIHEVIHGIFTVIKKKYIF